MKSNHIQHLLEINLAMLFIATSGALGRYVQLPVPVAIGARAVLAFIALFLYCKWKGFSLKIERKDTLVIFLSGVLMGVHWVAYFYALKLSNVAIGMLSIFTYPVITALLEPILLKTKFQLVHLLLAFLVLAGMYFLSPSLDFENSYTIAIGFGVFSALAYALRNILMKRKVSKYNGSMLMTYQTAIVGVLLFPFLFSVTSNTLLGQWEVLVALAVLTTAIGHTLFLMTFKHFNITTVSILSSVQPVYGILLGAIFLSEIPKGTTILGGILILSSVVIESVRSKKST
ncbi:DMT family transporter [Maribacter litoralis]|uniref:Threonine/homoserine efflux transporter RhtA n=1 Tax=Maribacter litoralis TaxID=2059726 RepID=A0A653XKL8_9FLAO|nr:DMT family transporter [Maribacter litoralis]VXC30619.1 Threonine/homoserine efflux transporter RhtA [Maribacter litoralis]